MNKLTVTTIALNEEKNLEKCLISVEGFADEIIVVLDKRNTDRSEEIAKIYEAKVFYREFDNFASQKNFAVSKSSGDWIFSIDADEEVSKELAKEIKQAINTTEYVAYLIPRRNFIFGKEIKHSWWSPDEHIWLWKKEFGFWHGEVHEEVVVKGRVGHLKGAKLHHTYETIKDFRQANINYAKRLASQMFKENRKFSLIHLLIDPIKEFVIRFFYKLGFLDGYRGLILALLMAEYRLRVWLNLLKLETLEKI